MAGVQTAYSWLRCGYRTLDDLRSIKSSLTRNQRIGLKYYDEFMDRMPRSEAAEIEATVTTPAPACIVYAALEVDYCSQ